MSSEAKDLIDKKVTEVSTNSTSFLGAEVSMSLKYDPRHFDDTIQLELYIKDLVEDDGIVVVNRVDAR